MYIIKNAFKSITRNKARNILIGVVILVIVTASCVALSIREAAESVKESTQDALSITAQISYDRTSAMSTMQSQGTGGKGSYDTSSLQGTTLTLDDYMTYTAAQSEGDSYYYTLTTSLNTSSELLAYGSDSETETSTEASTRGGKAAAMAAQGDFSIIGYSSYDSMMSLFGEDGSYSITDGEMFDEESTDLTCIISDELAMYNELAVGDVLTLANPNDETQVFEVTISGIYTNSSSDEGNSTFSFIDPANKIYMNYNAVSSMVTTSESSAGALSTQITFTYKFANLDNYYAFEENVYTLGLGEDYIVSSSDVSAYESSLTPLETLSSMAGGFFLIVLAIGGVILVVLNVFNLKERKYEIGVLTAIGMKKAKVAAQFVCEIVAVTIIAIVIGTAAGASVSVPVTNSLLASQVESAEESESTVSSNFGGKMGMTETQTEVTYVDSISSATDLTVVMQIIAVGIVLSIISSLAAMVAIMRYEPLEILSSRS